MQNRISQHPSTRHSAQFRSEVYMANDDECDPGCDVMVLRYKQPCIDWINSIGGDEEGNEVTLEDADDYLSFYLIDEDDRELAVLDKHWQRLWQCELDFWAIHGMKEPVMTRALFHEWFEVEWHGLLADYRTDGGRDA